MRHDPITQSAKTTRAIFPASKVNTHRKDRRYALTAPVVHGDQSENVLARLRGRERVAELGGRAPDEEGHLELEVHEPAGAVTGGRALDRLGLAAGPADRRARHHDRAGSAVVADRQVFPAGWSGRNDPIGVYCMKKGCLIRHGRNLNLEQNVP